MIQKILDLNYILKSDGTYFDIWKHRLTVLFKTEKVQSIIASTKIKPIPPKAAQIAAGSQTVISASSVSNWEDKDTMSLAIINNCVDNNISSPTSTSRHAWSELTKLFESQNIVMEMHLQNKLHTLNMRENENITKHIHVFCALIKQLMLDSTK